MTNWAWEMLGAVNKIASTANGARSFILRLYHSAFKFPKNS